LKLSDLKLKEKKLNKKLYHAKQVLKKLNDLDIQSMRQQKHKKLNTTAQQNKKEANRFLRSNAEVQDHSKTI
jgi:hypothetical protein